MQATGTELSSDPSTEPSRPPIPIDASPAEGVPGAPSSPTGHLVESPRAALGRRWFDGLAVRSVVALALVTLLLVAAVLLVMNTYGKSRVVEESSRKIEETGNRSVESIRRRMHEVAALVRTLAQVSAQLPRDAEVFSKGLPPLIDFQGDVAVAGGGFWPEPRQFTPGVERRSFFWGRDRANALQYFDDYNAPLGPGYHQEEWYVPARFLRPGEVFWSRSYQDPYSYQPMVTCTASSYTAGQLFGMATIDVKLEGLARYVETWERDFAGYGFLLDRNNKFLSFPRPEMARVSGVDDAGNRTEEFVTLGELARKEPAFAPIRDAVEAMDADTLQLARSSPRYDPSLASGIDAESYAIDAAEAERVAAVLIDPLAERTRTTNLFSTLKLARDPLTGEPSLGFVFHVPDAYWKLVLVLPESKAEAVAASISRRLVLLLSGLILPILALAYFFLARRLIQPVQGLARAASLVSEGNFDVRAPRGGRDELGMLASSFNTMVDRLRENTQGLQVANTELRRTLDMTDTIMENVREGLFLLSSDLRIEPRYSRALESILGEEGLAGRSFLDLIRRLTPEKIYELSGRFLRLLFNPEKTDSVVSKINPLKEIEFSLQHSSGHFEQRFLAFSFQRIWDEGTIRYAMVTVVDVSSRVLLSRQMEESKRRMERQAELLLSVMHVEPALLRDFFEGAHSELEHVSQLLRDGQGDDATGGSRSISRRRLVEEIFRRVHTIKGTASMLRISYFENAAHQLEDKLSRLKSRTSLDGKDFLPVVLELSEMIDNLVELKQVIERFGEMKRTSLDPSGGDVALLAEVLQRFVADLGAKHGKKALLRFQFAERLAIPFRFKAALRNVMAQLVRNSMVHGIETPAERSSAGKPEHGSIQVAGRRTDGKLEFLFRDDGRGLDYKKIIERAREMAAVDPSLLDRLVDREQNRWKASALNELVFLPGFTTVEGASEDAGRGYGLSAVREELRALGGEITVRQKPGDFCEFHIVLPSESA